MKKYTVICRLLISFGCIVFLLTSCDDSSKGPIKPTVVRKKLPAQGQPKGAAATQRPKPAKPAKVASRPTAPEVKPIKTETPPPVKSASPAVRPEKPAEPQPTGKPQAKPVLAQTDTQKPSGDQAVPRPKSDISVLSKQPAAAPGRAKGNENDGTTPTLLASTTGDRPFYNPTGKVDPFEPLFRNKPSTQKIKKSKRKRREPRTPLERIDISQLKLVGIILAASGNRALVEESSGKGYVIKKGTYIGTNAGKVTAVKKDMVVVEEEFEDVFGKLKVQKKEIKLPKPPGEL